MLVGAIVGGLVGGIAGAAVSYAMTGKINFWYVLGGAAAGALIGCGAGYMADKAIIASQAASQLSNTQGMSPAEIGRAFEQWFYNFKGIAQSAQQVVVKGFGRIDAILNNRIIELKNYDWSKYQYYSGIIRSFVEQASRYQQLIGDKINGKTIKAVEFVFSSRPPEEVYKALHDIGVIVSWIKG